jgi:uncharacterized membrane protein
MNDLDTIHHWHEEHLAERTFGQRASDSVARCVGSWGFVIVQSAVILAWIILNAIAYAWQWDPYPFILLNLCLSFQAAYTAPIIMISQNRQAQRDRAQADADYATNLATRAELEQLHWVIARIESAQLAVLGAKIDALLGDKKDAA